MVQILPNRTGAMREMITGFVSGKIKGNLWPMAYGFVASKTICVGQLCHFSFLKLKREDPAWLHWVITTKNAIATAK